MAIDIITAIALGGNLLEAAGGFSQGVAIKRAAKASKRYLNQMAKQEFAIAQREAFEEQKQAELLASRALAVAAASGGGASDPTVMNIIGDIHGEGALRAGLELYKGKTRADALQFEGEMLMFEARNQKKASDIGVFSSLTKFGAGMYEVFG